MKSIPKINIPPLFRTNMGETGVIFPDNHPQLKALTDEQLLMAMPNMQRSKIRIQKLLKHNPHLSETDLSIIHQYTDFGSNMANYAINNDMKGRIWKVYQAQMDSSLMKIQAKAGISYRIADLSEEMLKEIQKGTYTHKAWMSTSESLESALEFLKKDMKNLAVFEIIGKNGRPINNISYWGENYSRAEGKFEHEVLFTSNSKFDVEKIEQENGLWKIRLLEK